MKHAVVIGLLLSSFGGCGESGEAAPAPSRVVTLPVAAEEGEDPATFCEVRGGERFEWPAALVGARPENASGWRWINVWATWCRPCIEEMPRIAEFQQRLAQEGTTVDLVFVSADADAAAVSAFQQEHPEHPTGPRVPDAAALHEWLGALGLEGAPLPVHVFVSPDGTMACARTAAVGDDDYASVKRLLGS